MPTALLAGATGLVGRHRLRLLLDDDHWSRVSVVTRRRTGVRHARLDEHIVDFDELDQYADALRADDVFCCLGTTMKRAGSRDAFRRVDVDYPEQLGRIAFGQGARRYALVSAYGADSHSLLFYNHAKGDAEEAVSALAWTGCYLLRPSLLTGDRDEHRLGERIGSALLRAAAPVLRGPLASLRPTAARDVALAMRRLMREGAPGCRAVEPREIRRLAAREDA